MDKIVKLNYMYLYNEITMSREGETDRETYSMVCFLGREFVNFKFEPGELIHGQRYTICIHTEYTEIKFEEWTQVLPELNTCSDGVVVDLTSPTPGKVWIGNVEGTGYQVSCRGI